MSIQKAIDALNSAHIHNLFEQLYGAEEEVIDAQKKRYIFVLEAFKKRFGEASIRLCSSPGRSEIGGNHTDHNLGKVLAASIQLDCIGAVEVIEQQSITIYDLTYNEDYTIDITDTECKAGEKGSIALVRGIVQGFKNKGFKIGGFKGCFSSNVIAAAGVSSSASFEMMICTVLNALYNNTHIQTADLAAVGQFAENKYWNKSSGLLDQMACASGGLIAIDFKNPVSPEVEKIPFDFAKENYKVLIVNTGKGHADLSAEYSSIPIEMKSVAQFFGQKTLRGLTFQDICSQLPVLRISCGDRAVMRAFHFFEENDRVDAQVHALKNNDFASFLRIIVQSGNSSWKWLQNVYINGESREQPIAIALALSEHFIAQKKCGACRIHGGGFAGVIQCFLPVSLAGEYTAYMNAALGTQAVYVMSIRPHGAIMVL